MSNYTDIFVPADGLAPSGARPSAGTGMAQFRSPYIFQPESKVLHHGFKNSEVHHLGSILHKPLEYQTWWKYIPRTTSDLWS